MNDKYKTRSGDKHHDWKGDNAKYYAKHGYIRNNYGKASKCEEKDDTCKGRFEWSNKDHKYSRNMKDWQQLCCSHHRRYDDNKFNRSPWNKGNRMYKDKECVVCLELFRPYKKTSTFCSKSCAMVYRNNYSKEPPNAS